MYEQQSNRHLDDFFKTHPLDRKVWFDTKDSGKLPELYDRLVNDERFGVSDLVQLPEPHKTWLSWHLCGNAHKMLPESGRTFTVRLSDEAGVKELKIERGMKNNERLYMTIKAGRDHPLPAKFAVLAMDLYGPAAPDHRRNMLVEVRPWEDEVEPEAPTQAASDATPQTSTPLLDQAAPKAATSKKGSTKASKNTRR